MAYWLASEAGGQERGFIKRFSPAYWTVNFPRPMMAGVVTSAPDALRVDAVFYGSGDLAGLIWEAQDNWSHPLLAYETSRDFRNCQLRFHWKSSGLKPLDAINGPTLTIEGRDAEGVPRAWYVRLWNYAVGTNEEADISLDFGAMDGGFLLPSEADPVWAGDVDRMFISLVPPGYDAGSTPFAAGQEGWVELSAMCCDGSGSVLSVGDVMLPEHGLCMATGYDDGYNQTPERLVQQIHALGYRGDILHYVGMSHYFRLEADSGGWYASLVGGALNAPCAAWHADFAGRAKALGLGIIWSLSYELFDEHCPDDWKQRAENGDPALTGWVPPSTLLSPAHADAMGYLQTVGRAFVAIGVAAGLAPKFQVGEPWWWVMGDGRICLYDDAAKAAFGGAPVSIPDISAPLDAGQTALLDEAGVLLAGSTAALVGAVAAEAPGVVAHLLVYLPTVLDSQAPEAKRANMPLGWAKPAFDVLQLEDYDWVTQGRGALTVQGIAAASARLGYDADEQHYLSGFVLNAGDAQAHWPRIEQAARAGQQRGAAAVFIWALPQTCRDGFTTFMLEGDEDMQAFDDVIFPISIGRDASVIPAFSTQTVESLSGHERRSSDWADARMRFDAGPGVRSEADLVTLLEFFRARRGAARGFRFTDPFDNQSAATGELPSAIDQKLGTGDGATSEFRLAKYYGTGADAQQRFITRPVAGTIRVAVDGIEMMTGWQHIGGGVIAFDSAPATGAALRAGYRFDVPVRFGQDALEISRATFAAGEAPSVPLVEIRE
tara:strand:- start:106294 stop:108615 length:2322 start_codon:yes stop_codon:yes gene_type:complete